MTSMVLLLSIKAPASTLQAVLAAGGIPSLARKVSVGSEGKEGLAPNSTSRTCSLRLVAVLLVAREEAEAGRVRFKRRLW